MFIFLFLKEIQQVITTYGSKINDICMYLLPTKFMYVRNILFNLGFKDNVGFHNVYHNASKYICK